MEFQFLDQFCFDDIGVKFSPPSGSYLHYAVNKNYAPLRKNGAAHHARRQTLCCVDLAARGNTKQFLKIEKGN